MRSPIRRRLDRLESSLKHRIQKKVVILRTAQDLADWEAGKLVDGICKSDPWPKLVVEVVRVSPESKSAISAGHSNVTE